MDQDGKVRGGLERRRNSKWWYGRVQIDGIRKTKNLHVEVRGTPPGPDEEYGSRPFEKSKTEAEAALKSLLAEINGNRSTEELAQAVHEARTGRRVASYRLEDLPRLWESMPRNKPVSTSHAKKSLARIQEFLTWMAQHYPGITKLDHVAPEHARAYMDSQQERGISPRTWNLILVVLKSACRRGDCAAFADIRQKPPETVHRVPFTPEELADVLDAARSDELLYPLVVTAACTAMRKGDCCRLQWTAVDLNTGFISVRTSKTGRLVDIPLADLLRTEIEKQKGNGSEYVFPELARQYKSDPILLTKHFKNILAKAGFHDGTPAPTELAPYDTQELTEKAEAYLRTITTEEKRQRARTVFHHYIEGKSLCQAADIAGVSKGSASAYLNEIEKDARIAFIRGKKRKEIEPPPTRGQTTQKRKNGLRRASVRDFHALRTTWITLALMQGLPLELVKVVSGHASAEIVMQHYFKPHREQLKTAMQKCMPALLSSNHSTATPAHHPSEAMQDAIRLLETATAKNRKAVIEETLEILKSAVIPA